MLSRLHTKLSYANVMATVAVFIALGGSSYAAIKITGKNVKDSSLTTSDIKNGSLLRQDFRAGQLLAGGPGAKGDTGATGASGATGDAGAPGATGAKGEAGAPGATGAKGEPGAPGPTGAKGDTGAPGAPATKLFAWVDELGALRRGSPGATASKSTDFPTGVYFVDFPQNVSQCVPLATPGQTSFGGFSPGTQLDARIGSDPPNTQGPNRVIVYPTGPNGTEKNAAFNLAVFC